MSGKSVYVADELFKIPPVLAEFHPFALSLILGLLIGAEREYHHKKSAAAFGVRTFAFMALTGTLAAYIKSPPLTVALTAVVFTLIALSYVFSARGRGKEVDLGLTTEFAAIVVYCTGYILVSNQALGALIGVATLALLISREWLHRFIREKLKQSEVNAAATLIIAVFGVAPFLPDRTLDPWGLFNPRRLVTLISLIGLIHFAGYAAIRIFGAKAGLALTGLLGGFISSTAVYLKMRATLGENPKNPKTVMASGLFAVAASLTELVGVLFIASPPLAASLWLPLTVMVALSLTMGSLLVWRDAGRVRGSEIGEPLNFRAVARMGLLLSLLIAVVNAAHRLFSDAGLWVMTFSSGLFEMHGAALAAAVGHAKGIMETAAAHNAVLLAVAASFVSKWAILIAGGRDRFTLKFCLALMAILAAGAATLWV